MDRTTVPAAVMAALLATACGSGGDPATDAAVVAGQDATAEHAATTVPVTAVDYAFEGVPAEAAVGTRLSLTNRSDTEVHELVAIRLHDGEERSLSELLRLPDDERAAVGVPVGATVALPDEDGVAPGGAWALTEPGRYVLVCMIPQGADAATFRDAMASGTDTPPDPDGGPPHAALGMVAEITVR